MVFEIPGPPKGKARARTVRMKSGKTLSYTPEETVAYENLVKISFKQSYPHYEPTYRPIEVEIYAFYPIPKTMPKRDVTAIQSGALFPTKKPDVDNICKIVTDALNEIAYHDDCQIVKATIHKQYSAEPCVKVFINSL